MPGYGSAKVLRQCHRWSCGIQGSKRVLKDYLYRLSEGFYLSSVKFEYIAASEQNSPEVAFIRFRTSLATVDLPHPLSPTNAMTLSSWIENPRR